MGGWCPYTRKETLEIVRWMVTHNGYSKVRGNAVFKQMEEDRVCLGRRTWQSMRGHFKDQIIARIHSFGMGEETVYKFLAGFKWELVKEEENKEMEYFQSTPQPLNPEELEEVRIRQSRRKTEKELVEERRERGRVNEI